MNRLQKAAIVIDLIQKLKEKGSWCGETHLQKAIFFLQNIFEVPLGFRYILYKHGPYSFELTDEISNMRADELLNLQPQPYPYGPSYVLGENVSTIKGKFERTLKTYGRFLEFIAENLGNKGVVDLEKMATALFVTIENDGRLKGRAEKKRAEKINQYKPHISIGDATEAIEVVDSLLKKAKEVKKL